MEAEKQITELRNLLGEIRDLIASQKSVFNTSECAAYMNVGPEYLRSLVRSGAIPAYRCGSRYYFKREEIDQYLTQTKMFSDYDAKQIAAEYCARNPLKLK